MRYQQLIAASQPLLAVGAVIHAQPEARGIDNTQPAGENPIKSFHTDYLGTQLSANSCNARDLGFAGHIQGKWYSLAIRYSVVMHTGPRRHSFLGREKHSKLINKKWRPFLPANQLPSTKKIDNEKNQTIVA